MKTAEEIAYKYEIQAPIYEDGEYNGTTGTDCVFIDDCIKAMEEYASQFKDHVTTKDLQILTRQTLVRSAV